MEGQLHRRTVVVGVDGRAVLQRARGHLAAAAAVVRQQARRIGVEQELVTGHLISVLGDESRHPRLVVIGDRGLGGLEGLLVGSVAVGLIVHAHCPVAVVGPDPDVGDSDAP